MHFGVFLETGGVFVKGPLCKMVVEPLWESCGCILLGDMSHFLFGVILWLISLQLWQALLRSLYVAMKGIFMFFIIS